MRMYIYIYIYTYIRTYTPRHKQTSFPGTCLNSAFRKHESVICLEPAVASNFDFPSPYPCMPPLCSARHPNRSNTQQNYTIVLASFCVHPADPWRTPRLASCPVKYGKHIAEETQLLSSFGPAVERPRVYEFTAPFKTLGFPLKSFKGSI